MGLSKKKTLIVYKLVLGRVSKNTRPSPSNENALTLGRVLGLDSAHPYSHIPLVAPHQDKFVYVTRKGFHSLNIQAVCDSNLVF